MSPRSGPTFDRLGHDTPDEDLEALRKLSFDARRHWQADPESTIEVGCIEVGSWAGLTALVLAERFERVYCVDTWLGSPTDRTGTIARLVAPGAVFKNFCRNMREHLFRSIFPCRGTSLEWAEVWPYKVALVFIDADHEYEAVRADILAWRPHIIKGGILCGHDYGVFEGVTRAVDELIPMGELRRAGRCIWWTTV